MAPFGTVYRTNPHGIPNNTIDPSLARIYWDYTYGDVGQPGFEISDSNRTVTLSEPGLWDVRLHVRVQTISGYARINAWIGDPTDGLVRWDVDTSATDYEINPTLKCSAIIPVTTLGGPVNISGYVFQNSGLSQALYVNEFATLMTMTWLRER